MNLVFKISLIGAVVLATAAFGGTEPSYFFPVQMVLLGLGGTLLLRSVSNSSHKLLLPVRIQGLLFAIILAQIVPFPLFANSATGPVSIAPYETLSQLTALATYLAAFYLTIAIYQQPNGGRHLIFALLSLGAAEASYGLLEYLAGWDRMEMTLPFALAGVFYQYQKSARQDRTAMTRSRIVRVCEEFPSFFPWLFLVALFLTAIVFSESRMGLVSAVFSALLVIVLIVTSARPGAGALWLTFAILAPALSMVVWIGPWRPPMGRYWTGNLCDRLSFRSNRISWPLRQSCSQRLFGICLRMRYSRYSASFRGDFLCIGAICPQRSPPHEPV
jgi:hypothetical protein